MNQQPNASFKIVTLAAFLWFVVGCASASTPTPSPPSLLGTWVATFTQEDGPLMAGQSAEATFTQNGRVLAITTGGLGSPTDMGSYTITQDQLFMTDENGDCVRVGFPKATYKWSVANDTLTLTAIDDMCYIRRKSAERTWSRKVTVGTPVPTSAPMLK